MSLTVRQSGLLVAASSTTGLAWRYDDGSIQCMHCLIIETSSADCEWEPMPAAWIGAMKTLYPRGLTEAQEPSRAQ